MEKVWRMRGGVESLGDELSLGISCSPLLTRLLRRRGVSGPEAAERFLHPKPTHLRDPFELPDMDRAVQRIERAIRERQPIAIFGDYDVDGITSTCLLREFFRFIGVPVNFRLPNRLEEGYGIRRGAVEELAGQGVKLIITVDNGSSAVEEVDLASKLGVDVVVTDHHQLPPELPKAVAVVNPCGSKYPFQGLAGVGVTFKLVWGLAQRLSKQAKVSERFRNFLVESLALVALGTISDVVPLLDENRVFAKFGLTALEQTKCPGLRLLVESVLKDKPSNRLDADDIGFRIGPRLNAAGRLGKADAAMRLLLAESESEAQMLVQVLERENRRRQKIEEEIFVAARQLVEREVNLSNARAIVLASEGWHPGVIGIVASRICEEFFRPTILISLSGHRGRGSARSIPGVPICDALAACSEHLLGFGGHEMAAGVEVDSEHLDALRAALNSAIALEPSQMVPEIDIDAEISLADLSFQLLEELALLAPHGIGNPEVVLSVEKADVVGEPRIVGGNGRHLAFHVRQGGTVRRAIAFGKAEFYPSISRQGAQVSLILQPRLSNWQGRSEIELHVREIRAT